MEANPASAQMYDSSMEILNAVKEDSFEDRAFGAILGAYTADSCGSYLEFEEQPVDEERLNECMSMPGGGPHKVAGGQITDDSELSMCLMWGLVKSNEGKKPTNESVLNVDRIADYYRKWIKTDPFDIGKATEGALGPLTRTTNLMDKMGRLTRVPTKAVHSKRVARRKNTYSKSNGSLMRCQPMAVFTANLTKGNNNYEELKKAVVADVEFTHPEKLTQDCIFVYQASMQCLLNNPADPDRFRKAVELADTLGAGPLGNNTADEGEASVTKWLETAKQLAQEGEEASIENYLYSNDHPEDQKYDCVKWEGFVKHAWILTYYYLIRAEHTSNPKDYFKACIREIVSMGGDTDTNACIAGGMIGAAMGLQNVDPFMIRKLFEYDCLTDGQKRDEFLSVGRHGAKNLQDLIKCRVQNKLNLTSDE